MGQHTPLLRKAGRSTNASIKNTPEIKKFSEVSKVTPTTVIRKYLQSKQAVRSKSDFNVEKIITDNSFHQCKYLTIYSDGRSVEHTCYRTDNAYYLHEHLLHRDNNTPSPLRGYYLISKLGEFLERPLCLFNLPPSPDSTLVGSLKQIGLATEENRLKQQRREDPFFFASAGSLGVHNASSTGSMEQVL